MNVNPSRKSNGVARISTGTFVADGTVVVINLGFNPSEFKLVNQTDAIIFEKIHGQAASHSMKTAAAGSLTLDTTGAIVFNGDGTVSIAAAAAPNAKTFVWIAQ